MVALVESALGCFDQLRVEVRVVDRMRRERMVNVGLDLADVDFLERMLGVVSLDAAELLLLLRGVEGSAGSVCTARQIRQAG